MYLLIDFTKQIPQYNPRAKLGSDEDNKYWSHASDMVDKIAKKHNVHPLDIDTQFDETDHPIFIVRDNKSGKNHFYNHQGKYQYSGKQS